ncbi:helix-turn-helix domain-containing protein [Aliterella atlantica]|uniref:Transposase n=1 Tax=Aliterella atlantica CENA595 TaxID=1618023 RepID=A0A0D8ZWE4_9CYAN|nr:helix-turn-helix domain-containing protein [Aliterella atlantica]KJH71561.1 transposase [Aliterella atlantica CENA595]
MAGVYKLEIKESQAELKQLLGAQATATGKERMQLLYLLKTGQAATVQTAAQLLGRHRVTAQEWLRRYRVGGIESMLEVKVPPGRTRAIPDWAEKALAKRLQEPEGFESYGEIQEWLEAKLGVVAAYKTVHKLVYYHLASSLKVPRPVSVEQSTEQLSAFKKTR